MQKICKKNQARIEKGLPFVQNEDHECYTLANWLEATGLTFTHIANERKTSIQHGAKLKKLGVRKGIPDYMIVLPNENIEKESRLLFIEMKRAVKSFSSVTKEQHDWNVALDNCRGTGAFICYGANESIELIKQFLPENVLKNCPEIF